MNLSDRRRLHNQLLIDFLDLRHVLFDTEELEQFYKRLVLKKACQRGEAVAS